MAIAVVLAAMTPAFAQSTMNPSNPPSNADTSSPTIIRIPPSVGSGAAVPNEPSVNPSYPERLKDYSNPIFQSEPMRSAGATQIDPLRTRKNPD
jgi:hypothetical protein